MSSIEQNKAVVRAFFDHMNRGDVPAAFALLSEDSTWFSLGQRRDVPREEMRAMIGWANEQVLQSPVVQTLQLLTAEQDRVSVLSEGHAVSAAGIPYDNSYHFLFQLREGLITRVWEYNDTYLGRQVFARKADGSLDVT
jgi:ketosteroid isomerase-like protein